MYKHNLSDVEWGEFFIGGEDGAFDVCGTFTTPPSKLNKNGIIPRITCAATNNGLDGFYNNSPTEKGGVLTVDSATSGYVSYQKNDFIATDHVEKICAKNNNYISREVGLFLKTSIEYSSASKYGYGYKFSQTRIKRQKIMLPIDENNQPDWLFMEEYIKERENKQRQHLKEYYKDRLLDLVVSPEVLTDIEWREFSLRDLFIFKRGNQNNMSLCETGEIPLISAKKVDNGVKAFISDNGKKLFEGHILTLNNDGDGGVGIAYYQANKIALDTHVTALIPKVYLNRESLLFISRTITIQREKFSHGYSLNNNRMEAQKIVLPVDKNGTPNWSYMENSIKNIEQKHIKNILKCLDEYIYII